MTNTVELTEEEKQRAELARYLEQLEQARGWSLAADELRAGADGMMDALQKIMARAPHRSDTVAVATTIRLMYEARNAICAIASGAAGSLAAIEENPPAGYDPAAAPTPDHLG